MVSVVSVRRSALRGRSIVYGIRVPRMEDEEVPSGGQVFRMVTLGGAATTPYGSQIGASAMVARLGGRRRRLRERAFHPDRPCRGIARIARITAACARRRRDRGADAVKGVIAPRPALLCRLFWLRRPPALLPL